MKTCKRLPFQFVPFVVAALTLLVLLVIGSSASVPAKEAAPAAPLAEETAAAAPLKIAYSDWPGWLVWEIAKQKGFFKDAGVDVDLEWFDDYGKSIEAYTAGKLDGIMIACNDSLTAKSSVIIVLTDFSEGNDMIIGKKGVGSIKDLKGKTVGLEKEMVEHLLLVKALEVNGIKEEDVKIENVKTEETTQALKSGKVDAIGAWYPRSGLTLAEVADSTALFTSKEAPGLIYDALQVDPASLEKRPDDWKKVVGVWFKCLDYLNDKKTHDDAIKIMSQPIKGKPEDLEKNLKGTHLLDGTGNLKAFQKKNTLDSVYGSLINADKFYKGHVKDYKSPNTDKMVDPNLVKAVLGK